MYIFTFYILSFSQQSLELLKVGWGKTALSAQIGHIVPLELLKYISYESGNHNEMWRNNAIMVGKNEENFKDPE